MEALKNYKLHIMTLAIVIISELIGIRKIGILVLMPILYATIIGGVLSWRKFNFSYCFSDIISESWTWSRTTITSNSCS